MLCPEVLRGAVKTLGLGRGKIAAGWDSLAAIRHSVRVLESQAAHRQYRMSVPLGVASGAAMEEAEDVDIRRVKLPEQAATVPLDRFLVEPAVRESFLRPSTLDDPTKEPFSGRVCDRVPRAERDSFLRALDRAAMLTAVRQPLGKRAGFFAVRKQWDAERRVWILRLVLDRRPRNSEEARVEPEEDTVPHGTCFLAIHLGADEELRVFATRPSAMVLPHRRERGASRFELLHRGALR